ncbi:MAG: hypothetical protein JO173_10030 [Gammaproteobacteria bacterium]|nr:hypothetical protein [Gammaproteobacteria bacterium]
MSTPAPHVVPIFATPFGVVTLPEGQALNPPLAALFAQRAAGGSRSADDAAAGSPPLVFHSTDDLLEWPEEPVRLLIRGILAGVISVTAAVSDLPREQFAALRLQARAWFTIVRSDGAVPSTSYSNTSWLAVYCVATPEPSPSRADSGVLRMHESRLGTSFQDVADSSMRVPYRRGHYSWRPVPGQMAVFPASLTHEIALLRAPGALMTVTARIRFVAERSWMPPW